MDEQKPPNESLPQKIDLSGLATQITQAMTGVQAVMQEFSKNAARIVIDAANAWQDVIVPGLQSAALYIKALPDIIRTGLGELAAHGWYIDFEMGIDEVLEFTELARSGKISELHDQLMKHFESRASAIRDGLIAQFPARKNVLEASFEAHRDGKYELSVPVFLIQADGICKELSKAQLYSQSRKTNTTVLAKKFEDKEADSFDLAFAHPILDIFPLIYSKEQRAGLEDILNRHAILHGESTTYGTKLNSCKAISLLAFTAHVLKKFDSTNVDAVSPH